MFSPRDFTGDARTDVLAVKTTGEPLSSTAATGPVASRPPAVKIGSGWAGFTQVLSPGDFTTDSKTDVLATNAAGDLLLYRGNGSGGWAATGVKIALGF